MTYLHNNAFRSLQQFSLNNNSNGNSLTPPTSESVAGTPVKRMWTQQQHFPTVPSTSHSNGNSLDSYSGPKPPPNTYHQQNFNDGFQLQNNRERSEGKTSSTRINAVLSALHQQFPDATGPDLQKLVQERLKANFIT